MNLIGKIFIVLILVMSVLFMAFAMAVYATHQNWREAVVNEQPAPDKPLGYKLQLANEKARTKELSDQVEKLKQQYDAERAARTSRHQAGRRTRRGEKTLAKLAADQAQLDKANATPKRP